MDVRCGAVAPGALRDPRKQRGDRSNGGRVSLVEGGGETVELAQAE
jgi:hypothetical protein